MRVFPPVRIGNHFAIVTCVLVAMLLWIPSAVRATPHLNDSSPTIRLNHGFDMPGKQCFAGLLPARERAGAARLRLMATLRPIDDAAVGDD